MEAIKIAAVVAACALLLFGVIGTLACVRASGYTTEQRRREGLEDEA